MQRLGLFGGSFNPVHLGHLLVGQTAIEELLLDRLFFVPAAQSPWKPQVAPASAADRLQLLRLALAGQARCAIDNQELQRGGLSYTIDTARSYAQRYPGCSLHYLIGADHAATLPQWRESAELARLLEFAIIPRPGASPVVLPDSFRVRHLSGFALAASSSQIRERVREGRPIDLLVGPLVAEAIQKKRLYL